MSSTRALQQAIMSLGMGVVARHSQPEDYLTVLHQHDQYLAEKTGRGLDVVQQTLAPAREYALKERQWMLQGLINLEFIQLPEESIETRSLHRALYLDTYAASVDEVNQAFAELQWWTLQHEPIQTLAKQGCLWGQAAPMGRLLQDPVGWEKFLDELIRELQTITRAENPELTDEDLECDAESRAELSQAMQAIALELSKPQPVLASA